jgi:hypothetical protein
MPSFLTCLTVAAALALSPPVHATTGDAKAVEILTAARAALGGEASLAAVESIVATGTHRRTMGEAQMNGETEITIVLPDKYLRAQSDTMMGATVNREIGFAGDALLDRTQSLGGHGGTVVMAMGPGGQRLDPEAMKAVMLRNQRAEFSRLLLGWLVAAPAFLDATFTYGGVAESPDGRAHVVEVRGADDFAAKLFIDQESHRPLMLTYMAPRPMVRVMRGGPGGGRGATPDAIERQIREDRPSPLVEHQWFFDEYRKTGGIWLPHRLTRAVNGEPAEELELDRIRLNEPIKPATFATK